MFIGNNVGPSFNPCWFLFEKDYTVTCRPMTFNLVIYTVYFSLIKVPYRSTTGSPERSPLPSLTTVHASLIFWRISLCMEAIFFQLVSVFCKFIKRVL